MVQFLFIRHAESKDNLGGVWAGWKDSVLTNHGMHQCRVLADALSRIQLSGIHCSDLHRAKMTATAIQEKQTRAAEIPLTISSLLREQYFGAGEGKRRCPKDRNLTLHLHYALGKFPAIYTRTEKFPGGESLNEMAERVDSVIDEILLPYVWQEVEGAAPTIIAIVSHGLFIAELVARLVKRDDTYRHDPSQVDVRNFRGLKNTAYTKVQVTAKKAHNLNDRSSISPSLAVKIMAINQYSHLSNLHRQKGGIGRMAYDPKQRDIRTFFKQIGHTKDSDSKSDPTNS